MVCKRDLALVVLFIVVAILAFDYVMKLERNANQLSWESTTGGRANLINMVGKGLYQGEIYCVDVPIDLLYMGVNGTEIITITLKEGCDIIKEHIK